MPELKDDLNSIVFPREQWPVLYYILAGLNLLTIFVGFVFFHFLLAAHGRSVDINGEWLRRFESFERVAESLSRVNGPGNDVFDSHDVKAERRRLNAHLGEYKTRMALLKQEKMDLPAEMRNVLRADYAAIEAANTEMVTEAERIFGYLEADNPKAAGERMATMDRKFAMLNHRMAVLREHARGFQKTALLEQQSKARDLGALELLFAALAFAVIGITTFYGHQMSKRLRATRKIIEDQRISIQASAKLSALGEMAGGIAHEINNPLAIIQMRAIHLREMQKRGGVDHNLLTETTDAIERTTDRIACIIRGLRTFARDARKDPFRHEPVAKIIEETLSICRERFKHRNIRLEIVGVRPILSIECRATEISQVLLNLLNNAADAVGENTGAWVVIEAVEKTEGVEIHVTDSGPGIPKPIQEKMMQPFFTTKEVGKGTGLGLSISKGIVGSHGGNLWYDATAKNTRFVVYLPKSQGKSGAKTA